MGKYIVTRRIIVGTSPVELVGENPKRLGVLVYNKGTETIYILGAKNQAKEDGIPIATSATYEDDQSTGPIYAVSESTTNDVRVLAIGE